MSKISVVKTIQFGNFSKYFVMKFTKKEIQINGKKKWSGRSFHSISLLSTLVND